VKTDAIDLEAITELVLTGQGTPVTERAEVIGELTAWVRHRSRRVEARSALKNQLLGQLDRAFPGLTIALPDVLGTKVGRMVAEHFADPARLASLGESRFIRFAATRGKRRMAARLVATAREASPTRDADAARQIVANDLQMLGALDQQVTDAEVHLSALPPRNTVRGPDQRAWLGLSPRERLRRRGRRPRAVARPAADLPGVGLSPMQYESAGKASMVQSAGKAASSCVAP
jgi:transposase